MFRIMLPAALALSATTAAQHAGDIYIGDDVGKIVTGAIDTGQTVDAPIYVFAGEFGDSGFDGFTQNPGFDTIPPMFDPATRIGFNVHDRVRVWNGDGFDTTAATMTISRLSQTMTTCEGPAPGFDVQVQVNGGFHVHFSFFLNGDGGDPPAGVYLLGLELYSTDPALDTSEPFWIVFDHLVDAATHDAAIAWVVDNLDALPSCAADIDGDGEVTVTDLLAMLGDWGPCDGCCPADIDRDGVVAVTDLLDMLGAWGVCPQRQGGQ
jgi:hypothetical protein